MRYILYYTDHGKNVEVEGRGTYDKTRKRCYQLIRSGITRYIRIRDLSHPKGKYSEIYAGHGNLVYFISAQSKEKVVWRVNPSDGRCIIKIGNEEP